MAQLHHKHIYIPLYDDTELRDDALFCTNNI